MTNFLILSAMTLIIALVAMIGGLWLLAKQKTVVDQNGNVTEIEIPIFGKIKTNYPSLVCVFLGAALAVFVAGRAPVELEKMPLHAKISVGGGAGNGLVYVAAIPQRYVRFTNSLSAGQDAEVSFDVDSNDSYSVFAFTVVGMDENNRAIYDIAQGPTFLNADPKRLGFEGSLYSQKVGGAP